MQVRSFGFAALAALATMPAHAIPTRLTLDLRGLDNAAVSYHPGRRRAGAPLQAGAPLRLTARGEGPAAFPPAYAARSGNFGPTADLHPFGNGLRLSLGMRPEQRGRLLHGAGNAPDIANDAFAPIMSVGCVGQVGRHITIGLDAGFTARTSRGRGEGMVIMPSDMLQPAVRGGYGPIVDISLAYRF